MLLAVLYFAYRLSPDDCRVIDTSSPARPAASAAAISQIRRHVPSDHALTYVHTHTHTLKIAANRDTKTNKPKTTPQQQQQLARPLAGKVAGMCRLAVLRGEGFCCAGHV